MLFRYDVDKSLAERSIKGPLCFGLIADDVVCAPSAIGTPPLSELQKARVRQVPYSAKPLILGSPHLCAIAFGTVTRRVPVKIALHYRSSSCSTRVRVLDLLRGGAAGGDEHAPLLPLRGAPARRHDEPADVVAAAQALEKQRQALAKKYLLEHGVDVGQVHILLKYRLTRGVRRAKTDLLKVVRCWADAEQMFPLQLCAAAS